MATPNLRSLAALIHPAWRGESICEACGSAFVCGASLAGCWCSEVKLSDETRADLQGKYERCLCRACLELAAQRQASVDGREQR